MRMRSPGSFRSVFPIGVLCLALASIAGPSPARIHDGKASSGAARIVIPNVDDDDGDGLADGTVERGAADDEWLIIDIKPSVPLLAGAAMRIQVEKPWEGFARVRIQDGSRDAWRPLRDPEPVDAAAAKAGVRLALEVLDFADAGRTRALRLKVRFEGGDGKVLTEEQLPFEVAPFLLSSGLDPATAIHVVRTKLTERFAADLEPLVGAAGAALRPFGAPGLPEHDIWIQDAVEIGRAGDGTRSISVALHGNRGRALDDLVAKSVLGRDFGVLRKGGYRGRAAEWIDWFGNLEVSPPVSAGGRDFPNGRAYAGTQGVRAMHPDVINFLEAQGVQAPVLWLDTSWLVIGHVDETVSWVPAKTGSPYRMLIPSPRLALEILAKAEKDAPGGILNRGTDRKDDPEGNSERPVAEVLADKAVLAVQEFAQAKIDGVRKVLVAELGVAASDIIEIPVLFDESPGRFAGRCGALTPNMVNSLLVGGTFIVPDPHGPLVEGKDVLLQAVKDRLEPLGCRVAVIDDFFPYHRWGGEVHCGTNATRGAPGPR